MIKRLPIGLDTFEDFQKLHSIYVDKTEFIHKMMTSGGKTFFLSRPRRFGKSLLLSTMKAIFEGKKELFKGLYIQDKIDWEAYPVISLDMSGLDTSSVHTVRQSILWKLEELARRHGLTIDVDLPGPFLGRLIDDLYTTTGKQVVILVDEYDKTMLDVVEKPALAVEIRQFLQSFYVVLKSSSQLLKFLLITGVTKVSQVSIFSGLNNLFDISMHEDYAGICGYTQQELEQHFDDYVTRLAEKKQTSKSETYNAIKSSYNGYSWDGQTFVYNPYSVLNLFAYNAFGDYWFDTGTPTFLIKLLRKHDDFSQVLVEKTIVNRGFESKQTLENLRLAPLLFQSGYLTVKRWLPETNQYELQVPNEEVKKAMLESLVGYFVNLEIDSNLFKLARNLTTSFAQGNTMQAVDYLKVLYSNAAYHQGNNNEGYYHNLFEIFCKFAGMDILIESRTDIGRIDSVIRFEDRSYIIEIKHSKTTDGLPDAAAEALAQIKRNNYIQPYLHQGKMVHLLGLAFTKGGIAFEEELLS